jgi:hypothetical protein
VGKGLQALSFGILSEYKTGLKISACHDSSTGELHTASGEWLSNVFLALAKFAVRRPKTRWVQYAIFFLQWWGR